MSSAPVCFITCRARFDHSVLSQCTETSKPPAKRGLIVQEDVEE